MKIELKGIKRNTPGVISEDGELEELVNLRYKDGAFRPIPNRSIVLSELNYTDIYIHSNSGYKHYLGVRTIASTIVNYTIKLNSQNNTENWSGETTYLIRDVALYQGFYWVNLSVSPNINETPSEFTGNWNKLVNPVFVNRVMATGLPAHDSLFYFARDINFAATKHTEQFICDLSGDVSFTQMGNVINILDSKGIKYAVWYDNDYKLIDSNFDGEQNSEELIGNVDLKVDAVKSGETTIQKRAYRSDNQVIIDTTTENRTLRGSVHSGLALKAIEGVKKDGYLVGTILACTAVELYDGSYIMHSNPVILNQAVDINTRYEGLVLGADTFNYKDNKGIFFCEALAFSNGTINTDGFELRESYLGENKNLLCKNGGTTYPSPFVANTTVMPNNLGHSRKGGNSVSYLWNFINYNCLKFKLSSKINSKYEPLIKSISIFITTEVSQYKDDVYKYIGTSAFSQGETVDNFLPDPKTNAEIKKEIGELSTFYKVYEIPFDDLKEGSALSTGAWIDIDLKDKLLNLTSQEVLTYDNFSHHQLLPEVQFMYNSKLHLGDIKTFLSRGFPLGNFFTEQGVGQFAGSDYALAKIGYWIEVSIKTSNGLTKVVRYKERTLDNVKFYDISSFVAYPDARATKMVIHLEMCFNSEIQWYTKEYEFKLTAHTTQNYAYYISDDLKPQWKAPAFALSAFTHPAEVQREQINSNVCRVSEINNPFVFPVENTYSIGNGQIKAFSTNTIELSVGQAGQFPLYIFTSDGIYALFIGGAEVNYASSRPISREVINNKNVKPVDNGVIFTTDKGVMIISGSQVQDLSEALRGDFLDISNQTTFQKTKSGLTMLQEVVANDKLVQLSTAITTENVLEFIKNAVVGYKYIDKEIWFTNPDKDYSYIFSKGLWTKVTQTGTRFINDYPRQLILNGSDLVDISGETTGDVQTMFITRPLKMGDGFKQMITEVVRGDFKTNISTISEKIVKNGRLYNWYAINNTKGLAPDGWHIPSSAEILELVEYSRNNVGVLSSLFEGNVFNNIIWSQTESTDNSEMAFSIAAIYPPNTMIVGTSTKHGSGAVRCIKNDSTHVSKLIDIDGNEYPTVKIGNQVWITKNLAAKRYNNGDLIGSDFSGIEGAVATYNNYESNVYDTITKTYSNHAGIYIFGSYDGKRWNFLGGHEAKGELKDLGAKVERTDCKYFRIAFVGNISTDSTINYIEIEGKESLLNKKIR